MSNTNDFDPIETAKTVIGELASATETSFQDALMLQAGLRILLPVDEREGVALPKVFPKDPPDLQAAQATVISVLSESREATVEERQSALTTISNVVDRIGNKNFAAGVKSWLSAEGFEPASQPTTGTLPSPKPPAL